jgi:hypothetical protein
MHMITCHVVILPAVTGSTVYHPPQSGIITVEASWICVHALWYIWNRSICPLYHIEDSNNKTEVRTHCFDFVLGFCRSFFCVTDRADFPHMPDNQVFTALKCRKCIHSEHVFLLYVRLEDFMINALTFFQTINHIKIVLKTNVYESLLCVNHQD